MPAVLKVVRILAWDISTTAKTKNQWRKEQNTSHGKIMFCKSIVIIVVF